MDEHITPHDVVDEDVLENDVALEHPHVCMGGTVYVGHLVENEEGETVEVFEAYPCRRCPNFALWGFCEVRIHGVLRSSPITISTNFVVTEFVEVQQSFRPRM